MFGVNVHSIWCQSLGIAVGSAIALWANCSFAQITPDRSLPNNSSVSTQGNLSTIEGGTRSRGNLFHSFSEFSVPNGGTAFFNNASDTQNIISRVTSSSISNIDGLIRANGTANLFLINPNGIIFGPNASLNIGGSFLASTASSLKFADNTLFSAAPSATNTPLLTISVPIGLQYGSNPGSIQLQQGSNLQVNPGKSLALSGGNVSIDSGKITAAGGRVELGGLAGTGTVGLNIDSTGNLLSLIFPSEVQRADIALINGSKVDVTASGDGSIAVNARNIDILGRSRVTAGITENSGSVDTTAGNITVDATGAVTFRESSLIDNEIKPGATGTIGTIYLAADSLNLLSGSQLFTSTYGQGNAGNVNVNVRNKISVDGENPGISTSGIISSVGETGVGKGGDIYITTGSLSVTNGAQLNTVTNGQGNASNVTINARDTVSFDRAGSNGNGSGILTSVAPTGIGKGGDITITTGSLSLTNGAELNAVNNGQGNAGNVNINARDTVSFNGANIYGGASGILTSVTSTGIGKGGDITITAGSLSLTNGAQLNALTFGQGNAGNVNINARDTVSFDGANIYGGVSGILSSVASTSIGKGGDITITTGSLSATNGAELIAVTNGQGNAGNVNIYARDTVSFDGANIYGGASGILTSVASTGIGKGGDITITTGSFSLTNGAQLNALTKGQGNAGNVNIYARDTASFDGANSAVSSEVNSGSVGNGGNIQVTANKLFVTNNATISTASRVDKKAAGNIHVIANSIDLDKGILSSNTQGGEGNIMLHSRDVVLLRHGSEITTNATNSKVIGGKINIDTGFLADLEKSLISANSQEYRGGSITINTQDIFRTQDSDITATGSSSDLNGTVQINAPEIDPSKGLVPILVDVIDVASLVDQNVCARGYQSHFTYTGRGGLPPSPNTVLNNDAVWEDWRLTAVPERTEKHTSREETDKPSAARIVAAQGWVVNAQGDVVLVAYAPTATPHTLGNLPSGCRPAIAH